MSWRKGHHWHFILSALRRPVATEVARRKESKEYSWDMALSLVVGWQMKAKVTATAKAQ